MPLEESCMAMNVILLTPKMHLILIKGDVVFLQSVKTGGKTLVVLAYGATVDGYVVVNPSYAGDT